MKKKFYILVVVCIISFVVNIVMFIVNKDIEQKFEASKKEISPTYDYLNSITIRNFEKLVQDKEEFIVYIGRPDCSDCTYFEPIFREIIERYQLYDKILYLNVKKYRENNTEDVWNKFKEKYGFTQTPAIIKYADGKINSIVEWDSQEGLSKDRFIKWLVENKII